MDSQVKQNGLLSLQSLTLLEGEPMRMRLRPPYKKDGDGNIIHDGKRRRWYSHFFYKNELIDLTLKAEEHEVRKATMNLSKLDMQLDAGYSINGIRKPLRLLKPEEPFHKQFQGLWDNHVCRLLGDYKISELTPEVMEAYMEQHWGLNEDDELQVMKSSFNKEMIVLQKVIRSADPHFSVGKKLLSKIKYHKNIKDQLAPLEPEQIYQATKVAKGFWGDIFHIMLYTGMEAIDIYDLKPKHFIDGMIKKKRHKTQLSGRGDIRIPIIPELQKIFDKHPTPINQRECIFKDYEPTRVSKVIRDIFKKAKLPGYGAKSIRRYIGEEINSQYLEEVDRAAKEALAHTPTSTSTPQYTRPRAKDLRTTLVRLAGRVAMGDRQ